MAGIGLYMLFFTDNSGPGRYGTPGWAVPWIVIACGVTLVVLSRGKRLR